MCIVAESAVGDECIDFSGVNTTVCSATVATHAVIDLPIKYFILDAIFDLIESPYCCSLIFDY